MPLVLRAIIYIYRMAYRRILLLFSLAKTISNSACGLVRYCLSRLNKSRYPPWPHPINVLSSTRCGAEMLTWPCPTYHSTLPTKRRRYIALSEDNTLSMTFDVKWDTETLQWHLQMYLTSNDTSKKIFHCDIIGSRDVTLPDNTCDIGQCDVTDQCR